MHFFDLMQPMFVNGVCPRKSYKKDFWVLENPGIGLCKSWKVCKKSLLISVRTQKPIHKTVYRFSHFCCSQMLYCTMHCQWGRKPPKLPHSPCNFVTLPEEDWATAIGVRSLRPGVQPTLDPSAETFIHLLPMIYNNCFTQFYSLFYTPGTYILVCSADHGLV